MSVFRAVVELREEGDRVPPWFLHTTIIIIITIIGEEENDACGNYAVVTNGESI